ncbi:MAG: sigma-54-dependent Fis family transcriptional regulator [Chloroflexi bacterium]|nr:MAG: sigma-54-dependent Fis family transcriptional regulator [Chloroflexota bacterium]
MKNILFTWLGSADLDGAKNNGAKGVGPICQAVTKRKFDEIIILSNYSKDRSRSYVNWLKGQKISWSITLVNIDLGGNPTDYQAIYENAKQQVQSKLDDTADTVRLTFHLSPGTPQMATIWVILTNSVFDAKLLQSSPERGVQDVDFPFNIAADYLPKLLKKNERKISALFDSDEPVAGFEEIIYQGMAMKTLVGRAKVLAPIQVPVLIMGESGTGKELLAKAIHTASLLKGKFVAINCGAIPEELFESELFGHARGSFTGAIEKTGYIEEASGGTLFLDEIGEMPPKIQVKLLRVLQEEKFSRVGDPKEHQANVRIISATNRNLIEEVVAGTFREDMFHRLAVGILNIPPLRERESDLLLLIDHLLEGARKKLGSQPKKLSVAAKKQLLAHTWPGNVRELQNTLIRAAIWSSGDTIDKQDIEGALLPVAKKSSDDSILGRPLTDDFDLEEVIGEVARHYLERALKETGGNKSRAAALLNFKSYQTLDGWLKKYGV